VEVCSRCLTCYWRKQGFLTEVLIGNKVETVCKVLQEMDRGRYTNKVILLLRATEDCDEYLSAGGTC